VIIRLVDFLVSAGDKRAVVKEKKIRRSWNACKG